MACNPPRIPRDEPWHPLKCMAVGLALSAALWTAIILAARWMLS